MAEMTKIQWCDHSASPWHGCEHARMPDGSEHPGCANCYAERHSKRNQQVLGVWGSDGTRVKSKSFIDNLISWNKAAEKRGTPVSVFPSICDPFEDRPELVPWREEMFATIDRCPWVRLLLVTKRPENVLKFWPKRGFPDAGIPGTLGKYEYRTNVGLLTSVSDQQTADAMIPLLLQCRDLSPVLGISAEPLLGPIDLSAWIEPPDVGAMQFDNPPVFDPPPLDWVIVGGESGPGARPCRVEWIRSIVRQCQAGGVPCFVKQMGAMVETHDYDFRPWPGSVTFNCPEDSENDRPVVVRLADKKGGDPSEWPADLRVQQFPEVQHA